MGFIQRIMAGRNGPDNLAIATFVAALIVNVVNIYLNLYVLTIISYILVVYCIFRMLSRNIAKRRAESERFMVFFKPVKEWAGQKIVQIRSSKTHKFFKCPSCKNTLRVPKGMGKVHITCPKCGQRFDGKT